ncbi:MAG: hypothetical protein ACO2O0_11335 [Desulfurococcales archaeon]|nr:hypothetical protein [Desulfurococcales archaeon]
MTEKVRTREEKGYRGALILLYTFLGIVAAVWFTVYAIFIARGPMG